MNAIDRLPSLSAVTQPGATKSAEDIAMAMIGSVGAQVLGWAAQSFNLRPDAGNGWAQLSSGSAVTVDPARLAQGGDIYGLRDIAGDVAGQFGATPADEGNLLRALEDFTRAASLNVNALAGAATDDQIAGLSAALSASGAGPGLGDGIGGVVTRIEAATRSLDAANS